MTREQDEAMVTQNEHDLVQALKALVERESSKPDPEWRNAGTDRDLRDEVAFALRSVVRDAVRLHLHALLAPPKE